MTNDEIRMTKEVLMTNDEKISDTPRNGIRVWDFGILSSLGFRHSSFQLRNFPPDWR